MYLSASTMWVLIGAVLVFFMQAGFAMVETGFTRAKNAGNIIMKNLMDFCIGTIVFWLLGFGIMFGSASSFFGGIDFFISNSDSYSAPDGVPLEAFIIFQTVFCATAATIVSGAMAERIRFISYCIYSAVISLLIYPISGHWIWGGGWLAELGFHDFAGSTAVHMVGGVAALIGAIILGPRIGKYTKDGKSKAIPGHSLTLGALGVFILWFAWFGFNGGSTACADGDDALISMGHIFVTTNMAAACATFDTMIVTWIRYKKPDVSMTLNGTLAGLVAITAGCDVVSTAGSAVIGLIAGVVVVFAVELIDKICKVDDPVGAVSVHGVCGGLGTILTGVFAIDGGVLYGGGFSFLGVQILGVASVIVYVAVAMFIVFKIIDATVGLRVSAEEELTGLDLTEHGLVSAYADFSPVMMTAADSMSGGLSGFGTADGQAAPEAAAIPVEVLKKNAPSVDAPIKQVTIITNRNRFDALKTGLAQIGVTELYRGVPVDITVHPKVQVDVVVSKVPVDTVVETAKKALYTGHIGGGKIFIYDVEDAVKVRTGEHGYDALQDEDVKQQTGAAA